jgi:hypothetical protein
MKFFSLKTSKTFLKNLILSILTYYGMAFGMSFLVTPWLVEDPTMGYVAAWQTFLMMTIAGSIYWPIVLAGFNVTLRDDNFYND